MSRATINTALPLPPKEYSSEYMSRLLRQIFLALERINTVGPISCGSDLSNTVGYPISGLTIVNIPTDSAVVANLPDWSVWCDTSAGNVLKVKIPTP